MDTYKTGKEFEATTEAEVEVSLSADSNRILRLPMLLAVSSYISATHNRRLCAAFIVLAAITCLFFLPLFRGETFLDVASRQNELYPRLKSAAETPPNMHADQADTFYPWQIFINRALRSGELPLWNPYSFAGEPFLANGTNGVLYPPRLLLSVIVSPPRVHDLLVFSHMLLGGIMMFLLLTNARLSLTASLFGAIAWMLNSFMLSWMALEHFVIIEAWLPLAFLLLQRAITRHSWPASIGMGIVWALIFLGGNISFVEISFVAWGGYAAYLLLRRWRSEFRHRAPRAAAQQMLWDSMIVAVPLLLFAGLIAIQLLPTLELIRSMGRSPLSYTDLKAFKLQASDLIYFFIRPPQGGEHYHRMLFLGLPTALLALLGLFHRNSLARYALLLALFVLLVALGTPVTWLTYHLLPGFAHFKPLGRVLFLFNFAAAILAAFGLDLFLSRVPRLLAWIKWQPSQSDRATLAVFSSGIAYTLMAIVIAQMYLVGLWVMRHQPNDDAHLYPETPLIQALGRGETTRILPTYLAFFGSMAMKFNLQSAGGYDSLVPARITHLWRVVEGGSPTAVMQQAPFFAYHTDFLPQPLRFALLPRLSITRVVTPPAVDSGGLRNLKTVYQGEDGAIFEVANPLPRAYLVPDYESAASPLDALQRFTNPDFDPSSAVIIEDVFLPPTKTKHPARESALKTGSRDSAEIIERQLNSVTVKVHAAQSAWLVINESWDAGWKAMVDGQAATLLPGNYVFRTLQVPAGEHTVELRYQPKGFVIGGIISGGTLVLLLGACLIWGFRRLRMRAKHSNVLLPVSSER